MSAKEILEELDWYIKQPNNQDINGEYEPPMELSQEEAKDIYDCITNLQERVKGIREERDYLFNKLTAENKHLQEENKEWSMIFDTFSKRPYAHKYLEQKKKELNKPNLIGLDSETIYKDYYELKSRIDKAVEIYKNRNTCKYKKERFMKDKSTSDLMYEALTGGQDE